jgi:hypothetical protein
VQERDHFDIFKAHFSEKKEKDIQLDTFSHNPHLTYAHRGKLYGQDCLKLAETLRVYGRETRFCLGSIDPI